MVVGRMYLVGVCITILLCFGTTGIYQSLEENRDTIRELRTLITQDKKGKAGDSRRFQTIPAIPDDSAIRKAGASENGNSAAARPSHQASAYAEADTRPRNIYLDVGGNDGQTVVDFMRRKSKLWEAASQHMSVETARLPWHTFVWEPNAQHHAQYDRILAEFPGQVTYYEAAAWTTTGNVTFYREQVKKKSDGSSLLRSHPRVAANSVASTVRSMSLPDWFRDNVRYDDNVVLKVDIEGAEYDLMSAMMVTGAVCKADVLIVEWHAFADPVQPVKFRERSVAAEGPTCWLRGAAHMAGACRANFFVSVDRVPAKCFAVSVHSKLFSRVFFSSGAALLIYASAHSLPTEHVGDSPSADGSKTTILEQVLAAHYPSQYVVQKLEETQRIQIDGHLDEPAWADDYSKRFTGHENPSKVKVRWDEHFLYVAAELRSKHVAATVTGHCDDLSSNVWTGTPVLPYFDDDFEVFVDASQSNYFYVEYEMNARNATYGTLWTLPQAGLGSVAPECGGGVGVRKACCNTTWNQGQGLCDRGVETEAGSWTMEMYDGAERPGFGMQSAAQNHTDSWTLEVRFPILSSAEHGGLINLLPGSHYPGTNPEKLDPNQGQRFWWATFANALHAPWWSKLNSTSTKQAELIKSLCQEVVAFDEKRYGFTQFLVDANNAAPTCYYEAASQNLGGHQYMHNPDSFGYLQFATQEDAAAKSCKNVQWLGRFVLAQLYQAEVQFLMNVDLGNGAYSASLAKLLDPSVCTIRNACNVTALSLAAGLAEIGISAQEGVSSGKCVRYEVGDAQSSNWTGGPCFSASVAYSVQSKRDPSKVRQVKGVINEARLMSFAVEVGQRWNEPDAEWLCLDEVVIADKLSEVINFVAARYK
ncbi:unnamed protein product [Polarella glacialis]|uniref:Methyltransferase FkbM domain-containing protein n=1 Tax=Polarella glacialis TaxID=89957 RepID=A0A813GT41_POLGL|nr:unnamed protein product [Polarella glacialis]